METKGGFSGFRTEEREGLESILSTANLVDAYRIVNPEKFSDLKLRGHTRYGRQRDLRGTKQRRATLLKE